MASKYWIKLYHEILDDPKMGRLDDRYFRRTIELFLLAGELEKDGRLPDVEDMAWRLRIPLDEMQDDLDALQEIGIVSQVDGSWVVTKFSERQSAAPGNERTKRYRDEKHKQEYYCNEKCDETVTNRHTDTDTDTDTDTELTTTTAQSQNVFTVYQNEIGVITSHIAEKLKADIDDFTESWVIDAIKVASAKQARNLPYVEAILKRWKTEGKDAGKRKTRAEPAGTSGNDAILEEVMNGKF